MSPQDVPAELVEQFAMSEWERTRRHIAGGPLDIPGMGPWAELGDEAQAAGRTAARAALAAAWPLIAGEVGKGLTAVLNLRGRWDPSVPPGGFVCPLCGDPWEDEPSCQHVKDVLWHDAQVRAGALEEAAATLMRSDYAAWPSSFRQWLRGRAARLRAEADRG